MLRVRNEAEALHFIRERDKPLAAYLFTDNHAAEHRSLRRPSAPGNVVDDTMMFMIVPELPLAASAKAASAPIRGTWLSHIRHMKGDDAAGGPTSPCAMRRMRTTNGAGCAKLR